ncbi:hypothetical protein JOF42_000397 [Microbacterium phyllosphaerae]|uniref:Uncharacterized protein n=1 Tax=Microbacterium phyllosphaerae TaxID=124798 RepID=A0ABS4WL32_9MICO|nr:hypothetical protein [Microbacterium phyllosphaerae]MBP2376902.1 hypothetical protein [Microbacterium phyllosphaerae]
MTDGDIIALRIDVPAQLTVNNTPAPTTTPGYAANWCAPSQAPTFAFLDTVECLISDGSTQLLLHANRELTAQDWNALQVDIGVTADPLLYVATEPLTMALTLPTDGETILPGRQADTQVTYDVPPSPLGLHNVSAVSSGGAGGWFEKEKGLLSFSVADPSYAGESVRMLAGESFSVDIDLFSAPAAANTGALQFDARPGEDVCAQAASDAFLEGFDITCETTGADPARDTGRVVTFTKTSTSPSDGLSRTTFTLPLKAAVTGTAELNGQSTVSLDTNMATPVAGPVSADFATTLYGASTLGAYNLTVTNETGADTDWRLGDQGKMSLVITDAEQRVYLKRGDTISYNLSTPSVPDEVGGLAFDVSRLGDCTYGTELLPGLQVQCFIPDGEPLVRTMSVNLVWQGSNGWVNIPAGTSFTTYLRYSYVGLAHIDGSVDVSTRVTGLQPTVGVVSAGFDLRLQKVNSLGVFNANMRNAADDRNWYRGERGTYTWDIVRSTGDVFDMRQGEKLTWLVVLDTGLDPFGSLTYDSSPTEIIVGPCAPGADPNAYPGYRVSCETGDRPGTIVLSLERTGADVVSGVLPFETVTVPLVNQYTGPNTDEFSSSITMSSTLDELSPFNRQYIQSAVTQPYSRP